MIVKNVTYKFVGLLLTFLGIFFPVSVSFAQWSEQRIDSLIAGKSADEQLEILNIENYNTRYQSLSYAGKVCDTAYFIALETGNKKHIAKAIHNLGAIQHLSGKFTVADSLYQKAVSNYLEINDSAGWSAVHVGRCDILRRMSKYEESYEVIQDAIRVFSNIPDSLMLIKSYLNLSAILNDLGEYAEMYEIYKKIIPINEKIGDPDMQLNILNNMGSLMESQNRFKEALSNFEAALHFADSVGDVLREAIAMHNIGMVYLQLGENMKALDYLFDAYYIRDSLNLEEGKANTMLMIGKAYELEKNIQRANELYVQSIKVFQEIGDMQSVATALTFIGANLHTQGEYQSAIEYFKTSLGIAIESDLKLEISENYKFLLFTYAALGNEDSILVYLNQYAEEKHKLFVDLDYVEEESEPDNRADLQSSPQQNDDDETITHTKELILFNWTLAGIIIFGLIIFIFTLIALFISQHRIKK